MFEINIKCFPVLENISRNLQIITTFHCQNTFWHSDLYRKLRSNKVKPFGRIACGGEDAARGCPPQAAYPAKPDTFYCVTIF